MLKKKAKTRTLLKVSTLHLVNRSRDAQPSPIPIRTNDREPFSSDAVEIEYDDRHTAEGLREVKETTPKPNGNSVNNNGNAAPQEEDDGDDLDIDDI